MDKPIGIQISCNIIPVEDMEQHILYDKMIKIQDEINELVAAYHLKVINGEGLFIYNER